MYVGGPGNSVTICTLAHLNFICSSLHLSYNQSTSTKFKTGLTCGWNPCKWLFSPPLDFFRMWVAACENLSRNLCPPSYAQEKQYGGKYMEHPLFQASTRRWKIVVSFAEIVSARKRSLRCLQSVHPSQGCTFFCEADVLRSCFMPRPVLHLSWPGYGASWIAIVAHLQFVSNSSRTWLSNSDCACPLHQERRWHWEIAGLQQIKFAMFILDYTHCPKIVTVA